MKNKQRELIYRFFETEKIPNWKNIADSLIDSGSCIVAGKDRLWHGGIGNFIKTEEAPNTVDCLLLTFDKQSFLYSKYFQEYKNLELEVLKKQQRKLEEEINQIENL